MYAGVTATCEHPGGAWDLLLSDLTQEGFKGFIVINSREPQAGGLRVQELLSQGPGVRGVWDE